MIEAVSNFLEDNCNSSKKLITFVRKQNNFIKGCFTKNNNLGMVSDVTIPSFALANVEFKKISYTNPIYVLGIAEEIYISYSDTYSPIVTRKIAKHETDSFICYRYLVTDFKGKLIRNILINKTLK